MDVVMTMNMDMAMDMEKAIDMGVTAKSIIVFELQAL
jgi:hypothetical protein